MQESKGLVLETNPAYVADLQELAVHMKEQPKKILYPCCQTDGCPQRAFPDVAIRHVDMNKGAVRVLLDAGYDAQVGRVPTGRERGTSASDSSDTPLYLPPEQVDLLVLLNPQISANEIIRYVREGGYVICNNYHRTADEVHAAQQDFSPVAVLQRPYDTVRNVDTERMDDYFTLLQTDEEYEEHDPEKLRLIRQFVHGRLRTALRGIRKLQPAVPAYLERVKGKPSMFGTVKVEGWEVPVPLRVKESCADDLFLFQKNGATGMRA